MRVFHLRIHSMRFFEIVTALLESTGGSNGITPEQIGQGLTIKDEKLTLDLVAGALVSPVISANWTLFKNDGVTPYTPASSTSKTLVVDRGVKANLSARFKYPIPSANEAAPTAVTGDFGTDLPVPDTNSANKVVNAIAANASYQVNVTKPKAGLPVASNQVVFPTGVDTKTDSISISFQGRGVLIFSDKEDLTPADVQALYNAGSFQTNQARTFTGVTAGVGNYVHYLYDASYPNITSVVYQGVEQYFSAFPARAQITIVNNAGINQALKYRRSTAKNAYNNVSLAFS